jgi:hypothetical protein
MNNTKWQNSMPNRHYVRTASPLAKNAKASGFSRGRAMVFLQVYFFKGEKAGGYPLLVNHTNRF